MLSSGSLANLPKPRRRSPVEADNDTYRDRDRGRDRDRDRERASRERDRDGSQDRGPYRQTPPQKQKPTHPIRDYSPNELNMDTIVEDDEGYFSRHTPSNSQKERDNIPSSSGQQRDSMYNYDPPPSQQQVGWLYFTCYYLLIFSI